MSDSDKVSFNPVIPTVSVSDNVDVDVDVDVDVEIKAEEATETVEIAEIITNRTGGNVRDKAIENLGAEAREEVLKIAADHNLQSNDPVWLLIGAMGRTVDLLDAINGVKEDVLSATAEAAATEVMSAKAESAKIELEVNKYGANAKKYIEKVLASAINSVGTKINNHVDAIEGKMTEAMTASLIEVARESAKQTAQARYDLNKPHRWLALAFVACLLVGGGSYWAGTNSYTSKAEYKQAASNQAKWANFVAQWKKASSNEKAVIERVMNK